MLTVKQIEHILKPYVECAKMMFPWEDPNTFTMPKIVIDELGAVGASARKEKTSIGTITVNKTLMAMYTEDFITNTLPHEFAHLVCDKVYSGEYNSRNAHGPMWQEVMLMFGCEPSTYHDYNTIAARKHAGRQLKANSKPYIYICPQCSANISIGPSVHKKIQVQGVQYWCQCISNKSKNGDNVIRYSHVADVQEEFNEGMKIYHERVEISKKYLENFDFSVEHTITPNIPQWILDRQGTFAKNQKGKTPTTVNVVEEVEEAEVVETAEVVEKPKKEKVEFASEVEALDGLVANFSEFSPEYKKPAKKKHYVTWKTEIGRLQVSYNTRNGSYSLLVYCKKGSDHKQVFVKSDIEESLGSYNEKHHYVLISNVDFSNIVDLCNK